VVKLTELKDVPPARWQAVNGTRQRADDTVWGDVRRVSSSAPGEWRAPLPEELTGLVPGTRGWAEGASAAVSGKPGEGFGLPGDLRWEQLRHESPAARVASGALGLVALLSGAVQGVASAGRRGVANEPAPGALDPTAAKVPQDIEAAPGSLQPRRQAREPVRATMTHTGDAKGGRRSRRGVPSRLQPEMADAPARASEARPAFFGISGEMDVGFAAWAKAKLREMQPFAPALGSGDATADSASRPLARLADQRLLLGPIGSALRARGFELDAGLRRAQVQDTLKEVIWPMPDGSLSNADVQEQDDLAREVLNQLGWAAAGQDELLDGEVRRVLIAELFARAALDADSADAFLTQALVRLGVALSRDDTLPLWHAENPAGLTDWLWHTMTYAPDLFPADAQDAAWQRLDAVLQAHVDAARAGRAPTYTDAQQALALSRDVALTDSERESFERLCAVLRQMTESLAADQGDAPHFLRTMLSRQLERAWAPRPGVAFGEQAASAAQGFFDTLLPGFNDALTVNGAAVRDGSMRWCDHILAQAALRWAVGQGASAGAAMSKSAAMPGPADVNGLAWLAEQQVAQGSPAFVAQYRRLALAWAVMQPATKLPIDWSALAAGDGDRRQQAEETVLAAFAEHRAARWRALDEQAEAAEKLRDLGDVPTRSQVAETLLTRAGLNPDERLTLMQVNPMGTGEVMGLVPERVTARDAYLSQDVIGYRQALDGYLRSEANRQGKGESDLPPIDRAYREAIQTFLDGVSTSLTPFVRHVIEQGNGPRDTERQWSADASAAGAPEAVRRQAAKDWLDGKYYTRADRDFLFESEVQSCDASLMTRPANPFAFDVALMGESAPKPTSILLQAKHKSGEARDYLLWTQRDGTLAITRFAEDLGATNLHSADFEHWLPRTDRGNVAATFRSGQLDRLYDLSQGERDKLKEPGWRISHRVQPPGSASYRARAGSMRELAEAVMRTYQARVIEKIYGGGYGETDIQAHARLTKQIVLSMIPFYDCVSSAVRGDVAGAVPSCAFDALSLIPAAAAGAKATKIAVRTANHVAATARELTRSGVKGLTTKGTLGVIGNELAQTRGPYFAALRQMSMLLGEQLLPIPIQWGLGAYRLGRAVMRDAQAARQLIGALDTLSPQHRQALMRAYASVPVPDVVDGQRVLMYQGRGWRAGRLHGSGVEIPVMRSGGDRFVAVNPGTGRGAGPELVEMRDGSLRPVAPSMLPARTVLDGAQEIEVSAEVYRDAAGNMQFPVIEDWRLMRLPSKPAAALLSIDGHPYVAELAGLRRLTLDEQASLETRPDTGTIENGEFAIDPDSAALRLARGSGSRPATLAGLLGPGGRYDRYAVDLPARLQPAADLVPGANGLIEQGALQYIRLATGADPAMARYYRVERSGDGSMSVVHPTEPFLHVQIPVRYDAALQRWDAPKALGLRGGMRPTDASWFKEDIRVAGQLYRISHRLAHQSGWSWREEVLAALDLRTWTSRSSAVISAAEYEPYRQRYAAAFNDLRDEQKEALRGWSFVSDQEWYADGNPEGSSYDGLNYDLNEALRGERRMDQPMRGAYMNLQQALEGLPPVMGRHDFIRVADVPADYARKIQVNEIVTNAPSFMSVSTENGYALEALGQGAAIPGSRVAEQPGAMLALYLIQSQGGAVRPLLPGVTTQAAYEGEWLFPPDTRFRVDSIAVVQPLRVPSGGAQSTSAPRELVVVRLEEVGPMEMRRHDFMSHHEPLFKKMRKTSSRLEDMPVREQQRFVMAKNLHTAEDTRVYLPSVSASVTAGERAFMEERSVDTGMGFQLQVHDWTWPTSVGSREAMDRILSVRHWDGYPRLQRARSYLGHLQNAVEQMSDEKRAAIGGWVGFMKDPRGEGGIRYARLQDLLRSELEPGAAIDTAGLHDLRRLTTQALRDLPPPPPGSPPGSPLGPPLGAPPAWPSAASHVVDEPQSRLLCAMPYPLDDRGQSIFQSRIRVGDFVTDRAFIGAFSSNRPFLVEPFADLDSPHEKAWVLMELHSTAARPLPVLETGDEGAWLIPRNRVFRVQGISIGEPIGDAGATHPQRIAVRLQEVNAEPIVSGLKDLRTGQPVRSRVLPFVSGTRLSDWLGTGQRYAHYAVDLAALPGPSAGAVPDANGFIKRANRFYIAIESGQDAGDRRYYRVICDTDGVRVVHPQEPLARPQIPVRYDATRRRWEMLTIQEHGAGASRFVRAAPRA
jgi:hypothetical protein